jgi:hypothetical protein
MSDDPTEIEVKTLLEQLECCMVSSKRTSTPETFALVWLDELRGFAHVLERGGWRVSVLRENREGELAWFYVMGTVRL